MASVVAVGVASLGPEPAEKDAAVGVAEGAPSSFVDCLLCWFDVRDSGGSSELQASGGALAETSSGGDVAVEHAEKYKASGGFGSSGDIVNSCTSVERVVELAGHTCPSHVGLVQSVAKPLMSANSIGAYDISAGMVAAYVRLRP